MPPRDKKTAEDAEPTTALVTEPPIDYAAENERLRVAIAAAADRIEREIGSQWGNEKFNEGAQAAAKVVRAILG